MLDREKGNLLVRIAFKARAPVSSFDPSRIELDTEAIVLDNLFSPLVRMAIDGTIEPALAENFAWEGNRLFLKIRGDIKTVDGRAVTADDAAFTLKRLLVSNSNAHGDLGQFLCPAKEMKSVESTCEGISVTGNTLVLTIAKASYRPFLLKLLATMDFGIVPRSSCDQTAPVPAIIDFRNTSGPYFVAKDSPVGAFTLQANPNHWLYKSNIPRTLEFHPAEPSEALDLLESGSVDFISCVNVEPSVRLEQLRKNRELEFFETYPIRKLLVKTTFDQMDNFSVEERLFVYQQIRSAFFKHPDSNGWSPSLDFYPSLGEGALSDSQLSELKVKMQKSESVKLRRPVTLGVSKRRWGLFSAALKDNPYIRLVEIKTTGPFMPKDQRPDFYITGTDSSFYESLSLVSYNILSEGFYLTKTESGQWLDRYMSFEDKDRRIEMLKELNFKSLSSGLVGVLGESPYIEVSRKPFRYAGSKFFAGSALWRIRQD